MKLQYVQKKKKINETWLFCSLHERAKPKRSGVIGPSFGLWHNKLSSSPSPVVPFKNPAPWFFFFFSFYSFPEFKSTKKLFFFFNIHVRISIVEILGLVLFLGWFNSCLFDFLRFYRAVAFVYAIELFD